MSRFLVAATTIVLSGALLQGQSDTQRKNRLQEYLGRLSANKYAADSTSNRYGVHGSPYSRRSINNPYTTFGRAVRNPHARGQSSPALIAEDGTYLGRLNANQYDPESISNKFGKYGSPYSSKSINNQFGRYGSRYSPYSTTNPYSAKAPRLFAPPKFPTAPRFKSPRSLYLLKNPSP